MDIPAFRPPADAFAARDLNQDGYLSGREIPAEWDARAYQAADGRRVLTRDRLTLTPQAPAAPPIAPPVPPPVAPPPQPAAPVPPLAPVAPAADGFAAQVLALCNAERTKRGLAPFTTQPGLDAVAQARSQDMVRRRYFSHTDPDGRSPFQHLERAGIPHGRAAENIAYGQPTPAAVVKTWMESPGHRANLLNPRLTRLGVGMAEAANGQRYWTQLFTDGA